MQHRVFTPTKDDPIDFAVIEAVILQWKKQYRIRKVWFDPFQFAATAQRLARAGIKIEEFNQTLPNLTAATSALIDMVKERRLVLYPDADMRLSASRAVIIESARGLRLDKMRQHYKIDVIAALATACYAAVIGQGESSYDINNFVAEDTDTTEGLEEEERRKEHRKRLIRLLGFESEEEAERYKATQIALHGRSVKFGY